MSNPVVAILIADLHLSHTPPVARSGEPDWYEAMRRPLAELSRLKSDHGGAPILCAGDVFDRWNAPPELVNFALEYLPTMYGVPGQHDLPCHNYEDIRKSAYWTLVKTNRILNVTPGKPLHLESGLVIHGFPWGFPPAPVKPNPRWLQTALVHEYAYLGPGTCHAGAPAGGRWDKERFAGFEVVVFGDNHIPWDWQGDFPVAWNCGGFMRRNADQVGHKPRAGLLRADGRVDPHYFDTRGDVLTVAPEERAGESEVESFVRSLVGFHAESLDYREALARAAESAPPAVRQILREALG